MDPEQSRQHLAEEHDRLEQLVTGAREEPLTDVSGETDDGDLGTEMFNREADLSLLERMEAELADVEHALRRIDDGTYGTCEACGRPIGDDRLEVLPAARFCLADQPATEREARSASS